MTNSHNPSDLVQRGQAAARVGRREEARQYLRQAVQLAPDSIDAWLNLAGVEDSLAEKTACFNTVLELDPGNIEAQLGLEMLAPQAGAQAGAQSGAQIGSQETASPPSEDELEQAIAAASRRLEEAVGPPPPDEIPLDDAVTYCENHPNVETMLRCNRCNKLICTRCAVQTPVGYRCKQCVGQQQAVYFTGGPIDYVIGGAISLVLGGIAAYLIAALGVWFFSLILGPMIGIGISEAVRLAVRRRRTKYLWLIVAGGMVVGAVPSLLFVFGSLWSLLALGLYLILGVGAAIARLR